MTAFGESLAELWYDLRRQRVRAALSLLSIAWGTLAIVLLLAFSVGFEELFQRRTAGLGDGIATPLRTTKPWQGLPAGRPVPVTRADLLALRPQVPSLGLISSEFTIGESLAAGGRVVRVNLSGVDPDYGVLRVLAAQPGGRFVDDADLRERRRVVFLGDELARDLFGPVDPVGRSLVIRGAPFVVIGVMAPKEQDSSYAGLDQNRAFAPATTVAAAYGLRTVSDFVFRAADPIHQAACSRALVAALAARHRFDPDDRDAIDIWDTTEQQRMLAGIFLGFHGMLALSGGFTMLVGGIGIANLMFLLVRRRTPEIGLKLATGARPRQILHEVLAQALSLVIAGGLLGAALAALVVAVIGAVPALVRQCGAPRVPPALAVATVGLLLLVGFLAGYGPARRAARLQPVEALRSAS